MSLINIRNAETVNVFYGQSDAVQISTQKKNNRAFPQVQNSNNNLKRSLTTNDEGQNRNFKHIKPSTRDDESTSGQPGLPNADTRSRFNHTLHYLRNSQKPFDEKLIEEVKEFYKRTPSMEKVLDNLLSRIEEQANYHLQEAKKLNDLKTVLAANKNTVILQTESKSKPVSRRRQQPNSTIVSQATTSAVFSAVHSNPTTESVNEPRAFQDVEIIPVNDRSAISKKFSFEYLEYDEKGKKRYGSIDNKLALSEVRKIKKNAPVGVFATENIKSETLLGEYQSEEIPSNSYVDDDDYIFELIDKRILTARRKGNWTRFINHSKMGANVTLFEQDGKIIFKTTKFIKKGEQLLFNYGSLYFSRKEYVPAVLLPTDGLTSLEDIYNAHQESYSKTTRQISNRHYFVTPEIEAIMDGRLEDLKKMKNYNLPSLPTEDGINLIDDPLVCKTPLIVALLYERLDIIKYLLQYGKKQGDASISKHQVTEDNVSPFHLAMSWKNNRIKILKLLKDYCFDVYGQCLNGKTPLHLAIENGYQEEFDFLLGLELENENPKAGLELTCKDGDNLFNSLSLAAHYQQTGMFVQLMDNTDKSIWLSAKSQYGGSILHICVELSLAEQVDTILECIHHKEINSVCKPDSRGETPLTLALQKGNKKIIIQILELLDKKKLISEMQALTTLYAKGNIKTLEPIKEIARFYEENFNGEDITSLFSLRSEPEIESKECFIAALRSSEEIHKDLIEEMNKAVLYKKRSISCGGYNSDVYYGDTYHIKSVNARIDTFNECYPKFPRSKEYKLAIKSFEQHFFE
jgi:ankyrin repeat protein